MIMLLKFKLFCYLLIARFGQRLYRTGQSYMDYAMYRSAEMVLGLEDFSAAHDEAESIIDSIRERGENAE